VVCYKWINMNYDYFHNQKTLKIKASHQVIY